MIQAIGTGKFCKSDESIAKCKDVYIVECACFVHLIQKQPTDEMRGETYASFQNALDRIPPAYRNHPLNSWFSWRAPAWLERNRPDRTIGFTPGLNNQVIPAVIQANQDGPPLEGPTQPVEPDNGDPFVDPDQFAADQMAEWDVKYGVGWHRRFDGDGGGGLGGFFPPGGGSSSGGGIFGKRDIQSQDINQDPDNKVNTADSNKKAVPPSFFYAGPLKPECTNRELIFKEILTPLVYGWKSYDPAMEKYDISDREWQNTMNDLRRALGIAVPPPRNPGGEPIDRVLGYLKNTQDNCKKCICDQESTEMYPGGLKGCKTTTAVSKCQLLWGCFCTVKLRQAAVPPELMGEPLSSFQEAFNQIPEIIRDHVINHKYPGWYVPRHLRGPGLQNQVITYNPTFRVNVAPQDEPAYYLEGPNVPPVLPGEEEEDLYYDPTQDMPGYQGGRGGYGGNGGYGGGNGRGAGFSGFGPGSGYYPGGGSGSGSGIYKKRGIETQYINNNPDSKVQANQEVTKQQEVNV
ncbi:hypothetical protein TWF281_002224 [Arthrobotrys megalospora]